MNVKTTPRDLVFITGASSGIGLEAALLLSQKGYQVVGTARNPEKAATDLRQKLGKELPFVLVRLDLGSEESRLACVKYVTETFGPISVLINNAGRGELGSVEDTPLEESRSLFEDNYFGPVALTKQILPSLRQRGGGVIIFLGSLVYEVQLPFKAQYCAAKSALSSFALSLRYELVPFHVRVHLVEPGWVRTAFHQRLPHAPPAEKSVYASYIAAYQNYDRDEDPRTPHGRDVAAVLAHLIATPTAAVRWPIGSDSRKVRLVKRLFGAQGLDKILLYFLKKKVGLKET